ncbi:MAG: hypothetical protein A2Z75_01805 [Chloroflexi bacterium RBG_13_50_10]|nr:MAG: hypothetical protein A2Z75_01805 [Chloroflexi bacterium RBG_13_50_10]
MATDEQLKEILNEMLVPGVMRGLGKMNLLRDFSVADGQVSVTLASAALAQGTQDWLRNKIKDATSKLPGINEVNVSFVDGKPKDLNEIDNVIAVMSGKGGVGKSLVASLAAVALTRYGYDAGAQVRHATMAQSIDDCQVLIVGGMGWGAYDSLKSRGIEPVVTDVEDIEEAVKLYLEGKLPNLMERLH